MDQKTLDNLAKAINADDLSPFLQDIEKNGSFECLATHWVGKDLDGLPGVGEKLPTPAEKTSTWMFTVSLHNLLLLLTTNDVMFRMSQDNILWVHIDDHGRHFAHR